MAAWVDVRSLTMNLSHTEQGATFSGRKACPFFAQ
jgi:hypothetical protein